METAPMLDAAAVEALRASTHEAPCSSPATASTKLHAGSGTG